MERKTIAILGAGSWGTAVAVHIAQSGHRVLLWGHHPHHVAHMASSRMNSRYLPDVIFPETLLPEANLDVCLQEAHLVIIAVPSHAFSELLEKIEIKPAGLAWLTKGIDPHTNQLLSNIVAARFGNDFPVAMITGPSFAREVARFLPTALTLASNNINYQKQIQSILHHSNIRVYISEDLLGVQVCGAVKNVLAIGCGVSDGLGFGANAKAAIITRGLAEMTRLGLCMGAQAETFTGLAGVGDLVLTCTDDQSRNRRFGLLLGQGIDLVAAEKQIGQVVEGKYNAAQVTQLAKKFAVEIPICEQIYALLSQEITAHDAVQKLMSRPPRGE